LTHQRLDAIRATDLNAIQSAKDIPPEFLISQDTKLSTYYIPFEYVNSNAKLVLVGITPGLTQWKNAIAEMQLQLQRGVTMDVALEETKKVGAFSGAMRNNLIELLDTIGIQDWLGITGCASLFDQNKHLVQTSSILRHPVFVNGANYNGKPDMTKTPLLKSLMLEHFANEAVQFKHALFIPLGPVVSDGLNWLAKEGVLRPQQILHGLPHPSPANAERIAYFNGKKDRAALSIKTNADKLDVARTNLIAQINSIQKVAA
jgi:hypothetical protein